ncbi:MaoC family dehydratase [Streptomyces brevispora]|uniref:Acyl dehydratase n=1 Tax=Streptomyces brevispora TaxID=887462 RepID=A0A561UUD5_9ACTN|nr:MaoC family dehydratase [Streptomyces brevispora]TWG02946.1 acyl dehydratase [Streptomyces brevispora]WSC15958.1 MaoC family dehydratase [Streptomyces brevispora]
MSGLYFEEFEPGMVIEHQTRRTVSESDNITFCALTLNLAPLHLDAEYAKDSIYGERIVNSLYTLGLVTGISMQDTTQGTTLGNLGFSEITFPKPLFHGDTVRVRTEIVSKRESRSRKDSGIVQFRHYGINQRDEIVCDCARAGLMFKRDTAETAA